MSDQYSYPRQLQNYNQLAFQQAAQQQQKYLDSLLRQPCMGQLGQAPRVQQQQRPQPTPKSPDERWLDVRVDEICFPLG